ncbi:MAG: helix-hairpin-helix domain-containing protein, partial [Rectinemataceae bacterium]
AGLAKRNEEVWLPGRREPVILPLDSPALRVLVAVRDETHRFATGLSRKLRSGDATLTVFRQVQGIGEARARAIMQRFGSLEAVAEASPAYVASVMHIPQTAAEGVVAAAQRAMQTQAPEPWDD